MNEISQALLYGKAHKRQKSFLDEALRLGLDFIEGGVRGDKVLQYEGLDALRRRVSEALPRQGMPLEALLREIRETVVRYSIAQGDVRYLAFPDAGNSVAGLGADIVSAFLNQNLIAYERSAPSGTFVELQLIQWLRELVGYSYRSIAAPGLTLADVGGMWTSGGNMSNHVALLVALHARFPEIKRSGLRGLRRKPVIVLAEGIEHFSFANAAVALGLGQDSIVWSRSASDFTTDPDELRATIRGLDPNCDVVMVVSVAGNCRTTGIDDIGAIRAVCDEYGVWLHVDACHGGNLIFSQRLRRRLQGIEKADSVSLDPHKGLFLSYPSSYALFRDPGKLEFICRYPSKFRDPNCFDLGLIMPFYGSRGFHSLKFWALIKHLGVEGIGQLIEQRQELNDRLVARLRACGWFELLNEGDFYRTAFVFYPREVRNLVESDGLHQANPDALRAAINNYTQRFSDALYQSGEVVFDAFSLADLGNRVGAGSAGKYVTMAMAVGHTAMGEQAEEAIFAAIDETARPLALEMARELGGSELPVCEEVVLSAGPAGW